MIGIHLCHGHWLAAMLRHCWPIISGIKLPYYATVKCLCRYLGTCMCSVWLNQAFIGITICTVEPPNIGHYGVAILSFVDNQSCPFNSWNLRECLRRVLLFYVVSDKIAMYMIMNKSLSISALPPLQQRDCFFLWVGGLDLLSSLFSEFARHKK